MATAVNEANQITEIILEVWRRGARMAALPKKYAVLVWPKHKIEDLTDRLKAVKPELLKRLKKPKGWPRYEPFPPDWWDKIALGFEITKARLSECGGCGYPVAVEVVNCKRPGWYCPKCGRPADPPHRGRKPKSKDDDRESEPSSSGQDDDQQSPWSEAT